MSGRQCAVSRLQVLITEPVSAGRLLVTAHLHIPLEYVKEELELLETAREIVRYEHPTLTKVRQRSLNSGRKS